MLFYNAWGVHKLAKKRKNRREAEPMGYLVGYARVSTQDQNLSLQIDALRKAGVKEDNLHVEKVSAGSKTRHALDLAIKDLREGDTLVVWRLDRFARSMRDLYARLDRVYAKGAYFRSLTEQFDFGTITGKLVLGILGLVAEFERQLISQRTSAGIQSWKDRGGGKWGRASALTEKQIVEAGKMLNSKRDPMSGPQVAEHFKVSTPTIYKHWKLNRSRRGGPRFIRKFPEE
ncbi:MAG: DNA-invertase hin [Pseudorhodoplanes sp.]|nr:DNA-invertase hin [Pseudorhodoplanes sp.]